MVVMVKEDLRQALLVVMAMVVMVQTHLVLDLVLKDMFMLKNIQMQVLILLVRN